MRKNFALVAALIAAIFVGWLGGGAQATLTPGTQNVASIDSTNTGIPGATPNRIRAALVSSNNLALLTSATYLGPLEVTKGVNFDTDVCFPFAPATSNGTTFVQFGPTPGGSQSVIPSKFVAANTNTTTVRLFTLRSSGSQVIFKSIPLAANGGFFWDNEDGAIRSFPGETLQFQVDAGTDVFVSGVGVVK